MDGDTHTHTPKFGIYLYNSPNCRGVKNMEISIVWNTTIVWYIYIYIYVDFIIAKVGLFA